MSSFSSVLHGTIDNTNYFTFPINAYYYKRSFVFEDKYIALIQSFIKPKRETKEEKNNASNTWLTNTTGHRQSSLVI